MKRHTVWMNIASALVIAVMVLFATGSDDSSSSSSSTTSSSSQTPDAVDYAYRLCAAADATGLTSESCTVSGGRYVNLHVTMNASEARKLCGMIAAKARSENMSFQSFWQLRIYSPFASGGPIASCSLG